MGYMPRSRDAGVCFGWMATVHIGRTAWGWGDGLWVLGMAQREGGGGPPVPKRRAIFRKVACPGLLFVWNLVWN